MDGCIGYGDSDLDKTPFLIHIQMFEQELFRNILYNGVYYIKETGCDDMDSICGVQRRVLVKTVGRL
jgi:hypothetical protein